jgi:hypothetical protein
MRAKAHPAKLGRMHINAQTEFLSGSIHSDLTAAALMIGVQRAISSFTSVASAC